MLSLDEQKSLIEKFVRTNKNFKGNEDLFEDFCSESMQKSYMIFSSANNIQKLESYISKLVHTSIISVLKDYGRVRRDKTGYVPTKEVKVADFEREAAPVQNNCECPSVNDTPSIQNTVSPSFIWNLPDPKQSAEEILITKDCLQRIANSVCIIHKEIPSQQFFEIFYMRYIKGYKQTQIARELELSQSEVSKRLMHLSKLISNLADNGKS